ncbi:protein kinase [Marasmius crinis-equi]|uniref:Protein kinase n=1 Tax=Marasmius crinis-equi TaxID=585013 RepID=A0ABR3FZG5_9AGAR
MPSSSTKSVSAEEFKKKQAEFKTRVAAILEEDDPLAVYYDFVQWVVSNVSSNDPNTGLAEVLEKATNAFREESIYKNDLRYLKLWTLRARQVDLSTALSYYSQLLKNGTGVSYSLLYEEYAKLLEAKGRIKDADTVFRKGLKRQARPTERLKKRYEDFQKKHPIPSSSSPSSSNQVEVKSKRIPSSSTSPSVIGTAASRYALMLAPPEPGKRPEKLEFSLPLLYTEEQGEFCIEEARARSMGLLGKQWPALPTGSGKSNRSSRLTVVFKDDRNTRSLKRKSMVAGAEPTVTINTKEALADVFGMYNSPERTVKTMLGSKHAPVTRIDAITPFVPQTKVTAPSASENTPSQSSKPGMALYSTNEGANTKYRTVFRPFVDENSGAKRKENKPSPFTPFVDPEPEKPPARSAFGAKDPSKTPVQEDNKPFTFRPFEPKKPLLREAFTEDHGKPTPKPTHERAKSLQDSTSAETPRATPFFTPFVDEDNKTPFKVFSRPSENENAFTPKTPALSASQRAFTPFSDIKPTFTPHRDPSTPAVESSRPPLAVVSPPPEVVEQQEEDLEPEYVEEEEEEEGEAHVPEQQQEEEEHHVEEHGEVEEYEEAEYEEGQYLEEEEPHEEYEVGTDEGVEYQQPLENDAQYQYDEGESYREVPLGGRFGQFNVMTPITERTVEYTTTRSFFGTPSVNRISEDPDTIPEEEAEGALLDHGGDLTEEQGFGNDHRLQPFRLPDAQRDDGSLITVIEHQTSKLSLADSLTLSSNFKPENPCNPFDPPILRALLSRINPDSHYHDLMTQESNHFDELQRFARKSRKTSGNSATGSSLDVGASYSLLLDGHKFSVTEKLGEGGFGAVFAARDLGVPKPDEDDESDDDMLDDEDEEEQSLVALKVVKPRNIWEYNMLRRLHTALLPTNRRSLVSPYALYAFKDESYLVMDLCPQGTLLDIVNRADSAGISQQGACLDELLVMFFAIELLRLLENIHNAGFIHGDLKIDNCLLRLEDVPGGNSAWSAAYQPSGEGGWSSKGLKLIDFGRTLDTRLFPAGQQFVGDWAVDERDCPELREGRAWTFQTDYYGLAGIIYCMFFGKYIQGSSLTRVNGRAKIATPLKRYWQIELWTRLFDMLLNPTQVRPDGRLPIAEELGAVRKEMEAWLQSNCNRAGGTLKGLLKKVEMSCLR